ncbi:MAG: hypothetical protein ABIF88_01050 [archaeon]
MVNTTQGVPLGRGKKSNTQKHRTDFKARVLSISIAIIFVLFVGYAIETFYPSPEWDDYCGSREAFVESPGKLTSEMTLERCVSVGGKWNAYEGEDPQGENPGWCDVYSACEEEYRAVSELHNRNVFFVSLVIGLITFVVAIFLLAESVSAGFMGGGVLLIIYGTLRYWGSLSDVWRTLMLGFALGVLVWVGYKKLR